MPAKPSLVLPMIRLEITAPNGRKQTVLIPKTGDKGYDAYLVEWQTEVTKEQLMKAPLPGSERKVSLADVHGQLKEYYKWKRSKGLN